jgi:predicted small lipoprotein YifL
MHRIVPLLVVLVALAACGGGGPADTPEGTVKALQDNAKGKDFGAIIDLMSPEEMKKAEAEFDKNKGNPIFQKMIGGRLGVEGEELAKMSFRDFSSKMMEKMMLEDQEEFDDFCSATIGKVEVKENKATVELKGKKKTESIDLVKIDGKWYIGKLGTM